jgi:hypothetical protein
MKLANKAFVVALTMLALITSMSAQTLRSTSDNRNQAPTVGTGGPPGGPTGLFTIYDGSTLRRGEFTFSVAMSNYDRDPGNVDITEFPVSFQIGLSDHLELFFNTDAYRQIKVNSPNNLSSFYTPNSSVIVNGVRTSGGAIVLAPRGPGTSQFPGAAVFRPAGTQPFIQFPFVGGNAGTFGFGSNPAITAGGVFGFPTAIATIGAPNGGNGNSAASFPGLGSVYGSILPGIVLQTATVVGTNGVTPTIVPTSFTVAPSYLPDAPFINRRYGESSFNTFTVGAKYRFTGPNSPYGIGLIPFYRFYADDASDFSGFNQMQRGSSPGAGSNPFSSDKGRGDFGLVAFADARLRKWINLSGNLGYIYNSSVKANFPTGTFTILDRGDEVLAGVGVDFPVNKYFQPIAEFRTTQYVGGRTPNAFENSPMDAIAGFRFFPTRYISLGAAYRYHANEQDKESFSDKTFSSRATIANSTVGTTSSFTGVPPGFQASENPHGFILQFTAGRRNIRQGPIENGFANVTNLELSETTISTPCAVGYHPAEGSNCSDNTNVNVKTTAIDPENDVLVYNYTVSGGRIVGQGANVSWDLSGVAPGTYTITSGVDDGCGVCGKTQTKTITVAPCNCAIDTTPCTCPSLSISGPSGVTTAGETMTFTANASGGSQDNVTYNWTVSAGEIVSGQGTPVITVATTKEMAGSNVTATVEIGNLCASCNDRTRSETAGIANKPDVIKFVEFGPAVPDEIKAQLDPFYSELSNNPNATGYIINYGTPKEVAKREKDIRAAIKFRKYDLSRVTIVNGGDNGSGVKTVFYIVPAGVTPPTPEY